MSLKDGALLVFQPKIQLKFSDYFKDDNFRSTFLYSMMLITKPIVLISLQDLFEGIEKSESEISKPKVRNHEFRPNL